MRLLYVLCILQVTNCWTYTYVYINIICVCVCVYVCVCARARVCVCVCVCMYVHTGVAGCSVCVRAYCTVALDGIDNYS